MIARDWNRVAAADLAPLYAAERDRWVSRLQWDSAPAWAEVEHARVTWGLPGFVAVDDSGRLRGAAFYLLEDDRLDIGGITADHVQATDALLDAIVRVAGAGPVNTIRILAPDTAVALQSGLRVRGFGIERHHYLSRALDAAATPLPRSFWRRHFGRRASAPTAAPPATDRWRSDDVTAAADLLQRSYGLVEGRLFAPRGQAGEWRRYVHNLVTHVGCGTVNPAHSLVVRDGDALRALALITDIGPGAAHLVQLVVDPALRGQQVGTVLVERACATLREAGYKALTLMVAGSNAPARSLYARAGFRHDATFLAGTLDIEAHGRQHLPLERAS